jgi:hypothetical protein
VTMGCSWPTDCGPAATGSFDVQKQLSKALRFAENLSSGSQHEAAASLPLHFLKHFQVGSSPRALACITEPSALKHLMGCYVPGQAWPISFLTSAFSSAWCRMSLPSTM